MRCFIAVDINDKISGRIDKLQSELKRLLKNQTGIKWVKPQLIHLTLKFLGEIEDSQIDLITQAIERICRGFKSFELEFSAVGTFGRPPKVLWLGIEKPVKELQKLAADIEQACEELGFPREDRDFSPHLTLARIKEARPDRQLPQIMDNFKKFDAGAVTVDAVCFYKSQLTSDGPVYTLLNKINFT